MGVVLYGAHRRDARSAAADAPRIISGASCETEAMPGPPLLPDLGCPRGSMSVVLRRTLARDPAAALPMRVHSRAASTPYRRVGPVRRSRSRSGPARSSRPTRRQQTWISTVMVRAERAAAHYAGPESSAASQRGARERECRCDRVRISRAGREAAWPKSSASIARRR